MTRKPKSDRRPSGFSLLEMLAVLLLLGFLSGISAPPIGRYFDNLEFRKQTGKITAALQYARLMAITSGRPVHLEVEELEGPLLRVVATPEQTREFTFGAADLLQMEPESVVFFPEGIATPATFVFRRDERTQTIRLDPLTALPLPE